MTIVFKDCYLYWRINNSLNIKFSFSNKKNKIVLSDNHITYAEIRGQYKTRNRNIEKFKEGKIKVIFLNSKTNESPICG